VPLSGTKHYTGCEACLRQRREATTRRAQDRLALNAANALHERTEQDTAAHARWGPTVPPTFLVPRKSNVAPRGQDRSDTPTSSPPDAPRPGRTYPSPIEPRAPSKIALPSRPTVRVTWTTTGFTRTKEIQTARGAQRQVLASVLQRPCVTHPSGTRAFSCSLECTIAHPSFPAVTRPQTTWHHSLHPNQRP